MVEVVQDLLDHVTYAGGVGRRRVDAVRGLGAGTPVPGASDCAAVAEDPGDPRGPRIVRMQDLLFHEMLDKPFEEKAYRLQLEEFAYRGERIIKQVDAKLGEVQRMIGHDVLWRSRKLPQLLRSTNDELRHAHALICGELEEVMHMRFEQFFYPCEDEGEPAGASLPGGWLDLHDMFLTARLLIRYVAEIIGLIGTAVQQLPDGVLGSREELSGKPPDPALRSIVSAFGTRVPWIGAELLTDEDCLKVMEDDHRDGASSLQQALTTPLTPAPEMSIPLASDGASSSTPTPFETTDVMSSPERSSPLNQAITALDRVLTVHMKKLVSDLHRTMYQTFVRICAHYTRWKRAFTAERERALFSQSGLRRDTNIGRRFSTSTAARQNSLAILTAGQTPGEKNDKGDRKSVKLAQTAVVAQARGRRSTLFLGDHDNSAEPASGSALARASMGQGPSTARTARISMVHEAATTEFHEMD